MLDFEDRILIQMRNDGLDLYRKEYNDMLTDKATGSNAIIQDKYITISVNRKSIEDARLYFARIGADLAAHFSRLGSQCIELSADNRDHVFLPVDTGGQRLYRQSSFRYG